MRRCDDRITTKSKGMEIPRLYRAAGSCRLSLVKKTRESLNRYGHVTACTLGLMLNLGSGCADGEVQESKDKVHWDYEGKEGPEYWGSLSPEFAACSDGKAQSPINITTPASNPNQAAIDLNYPAFPLDAEDNGHTLVVTVPPGSTMKVGTETYNLLSFHYHTGSEHTIEGVQAPMEIHFVHKNAVTGGLGVLGVMVNAGTENPQLAQLLANLPDPAGVKQVPTVMIDPLELLPTDLSYFAYDGSLTTPPCTEGVRWHVLEQPITATQEQIDGFLGIYGANFRPVQPLNGRKVNVSETDQAP